MNNIPQTMIGRLALAKGNPASACLIKQEKPPGKWLCRMLMNR
jgi:hypothetical protein